MSKKVASLVWLVFHACQTSSDANVTNSECSDDISLIQIESSLYHRSGQSKQQPIEQIPKGTVPASAPTSRLELASGAEQKSVEDKVVLERPGLLEGKTDYVTFGVLLKKWHGIDFDHGTSHVDAIITLRWKDKRAAAMVPAGKKSIRLSIENAKDNIWLPDISITNLAKKVSDVISSSVLIEANGDITKVQRVYMHVKESFLIHNFPFDTQNATVELASATYMDDELQLIPTSEASEWGIPKGPNLFENSAWNFEKSSITSFLDEDGSLKKSRGIMTLTVKRTPNQFLMSIFLPSVVLLFMTWSAFWLPMSGPYVMPRVAINAFALLCQLNVSNTACKSMPNNGQASFMTEYLTLCIELQFTLMIINVLLLSMETSKVDATVTQDINHMVIVSFPLTTTLNIIVLALGWFTISNIVVTVSVLYYFVHLYMEHRAAEEAHEAAAKQEEESPATEKEEAEKKSAEEAQAKRAEEERLAKEKEEAEAKATEEAEAKRVEEERLAKEKEEAKTEEAKTDT